MTDRTFLRLRRGTSIRRLVTLRGARNDIQVASGAALTRRVAAPSTCTVSGQVFVAVRRSR